jgi:hypothetical protein
MVSGSHLYDCRPKQYCNKYFKIFAYIDYDGQSELQILSEQWNTDSYLKLFDSCMLDLLKTNGRILLHENDTCHKCRKAVRHIDRHGII